MSGWVLPSYALFITLAFGVRSVVHLRLTGALPWVRPSSATQWVSEGLLAAGGAATFIACILSVAGVIPSIEGLDSAPGRALGAGLIVGAIALSVTTQAQMGRSWRAGVDPAARTELVTHGVFGSVRNPFYVSMILAAAGVALMIPSALSVAAVMVTVAGAEAVVRLSEEPYLQRVHRDAFAAYRARTGRFLPGLGRDRLDGRGRG